MWIMYEKTGWKIFGTQIRCLFQSQSKKLEHKVHWSEMRRGVLKGADFCVLGNYELGHSHSFLCNENNLKW